jgi:preprotein translocase subunit SecD
VSLRGRVISVGLVVVFMAFLAVPSFYSPEERRESPWIADNGINLGLDLKGGVHWLLQIDVTTAVRQELERSESLMKELLAERGIEDPDLRVVEEGKIKGAGDPSTLAAIREVVGESFTSLAVTEDGSRISLELTSEWQDQVVQRGVLQAQEVLRKRIDGIGVTEPVIAPQGDDRILVQLPGEVDPVAARQILEKTTFLEFKLVVDSAPSEELLQAKYPGDLPADHQIVLVKNEDDSVAEVLLVPERPALTGAMLEDARLNFDRRGRAIVGFTWNSEGARLFRDFTGSHVGERLAAIVDGEVVTAPVIQDRIGRRGQITGQFTEQEAANMAVALRSGALPIPLIIEEERTVGPNLGADSIRRGLRSILLGGALVILFMIIYYRLSGLLANVALLINLVIIIATHVAGNRRARPHRRDFRRRERDHLRAHTGGASRREERAELRASRVSPLGTHDLRCERHDPHCRHRSLSLRKWPGSGVCRHAVDRNSVERLLCPRGDSALHRPPADAPRGASDLTWSWYDPIPTSTSSSRHASAPRSPSRLWCSPSFWGSSWVPSSGSTLPAARSCRCRFRRLRARSTRAGCGLS